MKAVKDKSRVVLDESYFGKPAAQQPAAPAQQPPVKP
jgi:hypothetical protein